MTRRTEVLAQRLEEGVRELMELARSLSDEEWQARIPGDGRKIGVVVHHVASMYPIEIQLALTLAAGRPVEGVTWNDIHALNASHAAQHAAITKNEALSLLRTNSAAAAAAVRALSDAELDEALREAKQDLWGARFALSTRQLKDYSSIPQTRRTIARILTVQRERQGARSKTA